MATNKKENVDIYSIQQWLNAGQTIATQAKYYGRLKDINGDNQGDFDYIYFFADESKPDVLNICTACRKLKKRNAKGVSDRELKSVLGEFISYSELLLKSSDSATQVRDWLVSNKRVPDWDKTIRQREGTLQDFHSESEYKDTFWKRANLFISDIGDTMESLSGLGFSAASIVLFYGIILAVVVGVIITWVKEGFGTAILMAVISVISGYIAFSLGALAIVLARIVLFIPRYFFKNIYWFIGGLAIWAFFVSLYAF